MLLTPLEQALDLFLTGYYSNTNNTNIGNTRDIVVKYWCQQEHLNLNAHSDINKVLFEQQQHSNPTSTNNNTTTTMAVEQQRHHHHCPNPQQQAVWRN